jgi:hypothetical protein
MADLPPFRVKCNSISYRKGFIEVTPGIHVGCVNIETWEIAIDTSLDSAAWVDHPSVADTSILANTELELTAQQARSLAKALLEAADAVDSPTD